VAPNAIGTALQELPPPTKSITTKTSMNASGLMFQFMDRASNFAGVAHQRD
jgi:hypothetical protein